MSLDDENNREQRLKPLRAVKSTPHVQPQVLSGMDKANYAMIKGDFAEAERLYRLQIEELEAKLGPNHFDIAVVLHSLALVLEIQNKLEESQQIRERTSVILMHQHMDETRAAQPGE